MTSLTDLEFKASRVCSINVKCQDRCTSLLTCWDRRCCLPQLGLLSQRFSCGVMSAGGSGLLLASSSLACGGGGRASLPCLPEVMCSRALHAPIPPASFLLFLLLVHASSCCAMAMRPGEPEEIRTSTVLSGQAQPQPAPVFTSQPAFIAGKTTCGCPTCGTSQHAYVLLAMPHAVTHLQMPACGTGMPLPHTPSMQVAAYVTVLDKDLTDRKRTSELDITSHVAASYGSLVTRLCSQRLKYVPLKFHAQAPTQLLSPGDAALSAFVLH